MSSLSATAVELAYFCLLSPSARIARYYLARVHLCLLGR